MLIGSRGNTENKMDLREEFQHHADECFRMAAETKDRLSKATWMQMANRWAIAAQNQGKLDEHAVVLRRARQSLLARETTSGRRRVRRSGGAEDGRDLPPQTGGM